MTLANLNPYRPGEPNCPMLAYFGRIQECETARSVLFSVQTTRAQDWPQGEPERQAKITLAEIEVLRAEDAVNEIRQHAANLFRWMKGVAEAWYVDDLFADPEPESSVFVKRAVDHWKADVIQRAAGMAGSRETGPDVVPLWKRGKA